MKQAVGCRGDAVDGKSAWMDHSSIPSLSRAGEEVGNVISELGSGWRV